MWCGNCGRNISRSDNIDGKICCPCCGRVLDEDNFSQEPTFSKNAAGQSQLSGNFVRGMNEFSASRERTLGEARDVIESIMYALGIDGGGSIAQAALRFYEIALDRNFTRGRRKEQVGAACLYIACRDDKKPYLLIDFSEYLTINVYVLGAVFLQLCKLLSLEEHPIVQKPVDPSLFIHRFTDRLFGGRKPDVSRTALHIIASMKRDWMQTGRKPSGLCGAALYISALSHGVKRSKSEIIRIVHICEATLTKRLIEFESTESGSLTIDEFTTKAEELEKEERSANFARSKFKAYGINELLCEHKGSGKPHIAHGLCEDCYTDFFKLSGGLDGGSEPPAFQRAEMERIMAKEAAAQISENVDPSILCSPTENYGELLNSNIKGSIKNVSEYGDSRSRESDLTGATLQRDITRDSSNDGIHQGEATFEETETLSDIEDAEVDGYLLHNEEEKRLRKTIWEELNKEYLEEQAAKEAAAEAIRKANEARFKNCSEDVRAAHELAEAAKASVAKSKKEKQQKRAAELKNMGPAQSALEATKLVLGKKRLSSRIRYDVLDKLFEEPDPETTKKSRTDSNDNSYINKNNEDPETETIENAYFDNEEEEIYEDFFDDF